MVTKWVKSAVLGATVFSAVVGVAPQVAHAQLIASDSYKIGATPANGEYANNTSLASQASVTVSGFTNTLGGSGTSQFQSQLVGLAYAPLGITSADSGKVRYINAGIDSTNRSTARNLATPVTSSSTYWISYLLNRPSISSSLPTGRDFVGVGFGNATVPVLGTSGMTGLYAGYSGDAGNLVLRYRDNSNGGAGVNVETTLLTAGGATPIDDQTFLVIAQINVNVNTGTGDNVTYWVNPTSFTNIAALNSTATTTGTFTGNLLSASTDFVRLNYFSRNFNSDAFFDEPRLGTTLASIAPSIVTASPEPGSIALIALGGTVLFGARIRRRRQA